MGLGRTWLSRLRQVLPPHPQRFLIVDSSGTTVGTGCMVIALTPFPHYFKSFLTIYKKL
jgi:hypothetical protein